jgi:heme exporter protein C
MDVEKLTPARIGFILLAIGATIYSFMIPELKLFPAPGMARIFTWHFPCAILCPSYLAVASYQALRHNMGKSGGRPWAELARMDQKLDVAMLLSVTFCILTMLTGMIFSRAQWGAWWQGDPRQTSFLLVCLIIGAYFGLRSSIADEVRRASACAGYVLASFLPLTFLIFVFPRIGKAGQTSSHPQDTISGAKLSFEYALSMSLVFATVLIAAIFIARLALRRFDAKTQHESDLLASDPTASSARLVRPGTQPVDRDATS